MPKIPKAQIIAPKPPALWVGTKDITQGKELWTISDTMSVVVPFTGPFTALLPGRPVRGARLRGFDVHGLQVDRCEVERLDGDAGELRVYLSAPQPDEPGETGFAPIGEPVYTVDWLELDKRIEELPECGYLTSEALADGLDWDDWRKFSTPPEGKTYYQNSGNGWNLSQYIELKASGIDSKRVFYPKVSRTIYYHTKPAEVGTMSGKRDTPTGVTVPGDWQWLCGADRIVKTGKKYERTTEWLGADEWNPTLYGNP